MKTPLLFSGLGPEFAIRCNGRGYPSASAGATYSWTASDRTVVHYHLSPADAARPVALLVRSLISGTIVQKLPLAGSRTEAILLTQDLPNGVYVVTLLVNGQAVPNRRLLVNH